MSQEINIENYEAFAIDFIEGKLSPNMHRSFEAFLLLYPGIAEGILGLESATMPVIENELSNAFKQSLKIEIITAAGIDESNFEDSFAQAVDQDLNPELVKNTLQFIELNPALANDFLAYQHTKLKPDLSVAFTEKSTLKRPIPLWSNFSAPIFKVAAAIAIVIGLASTLIYNNQGLYQPRFEQNTQFAALEVEPISNFPLNDKIERSKANLENVQLPQKLSQNTQEISPIATIQVKHVKAIEKNTLSENRFLAKTYQNQPEQIKPEGLTVATNTARATVLNLTQFIGLRFLGIEPNKAENPKALLNAYAERIELFAVSDDHEKRTFTIAKGRFEYTQVLHEYK